MRYAFFLGCKIPHYVPHYGISTRAVLDHLGVELVDLEFTCCGYPMSHLYYKSSVYSSIRNLALAQARDLDLATPCKCCYGQFMRTLDVMERVPEFKREIMSQLGEEGLVYPDRIRVRHVEQVLHDDIGLEAIKPRIKRRFKQLRAASLYGCHAIRPSNVTRFENPQGPHLVDELINLTGAESINWAGRMSCCGAPIREHNPELSLAIITKRLTECRDAKADIMIIDCPYSQMQAERAWAQPRPLADRELIYGAILYPQLLGLTLGLTPQQLALEKNTPDAEYLLSFLE
jgi:heterodisulfide reductase subunit B